MLQNYFSVALRNLLRYKGYSFLNIFGLAIGMACSILILLWVRDELSYDQFHLHASRTYRITVEASGLKAAVSPAPLGKAMLDQIPEMAHAVRLTSDGSLFVLGDRRFQEKNIFYADSNFFSVFQFPLLRGDTRTALTRPDAILLTEETAIKYFGSQDPIGKTLKMNNEHLFTVTGVLQNIPRNSHLKFDILLPMAFRSRTDNDLNNNLWDNFNFYTYLTIKESVEPTEALRARLEKQMNQIYRDNEKGLKVSLLLQPMNRIHLHSGSQVADVPGHGNFQYVQIFSVVAVFILLVACINFMNLATARAARRAKEVGMRKVLGAYYKQLIGQFMGESMLIAVFSLVVALIISLALLPVFNSISGKQISLQDLNGGFLAGLLGMTLLTGLLAGSYPALYLSSFEPIQSLKGTFRAGRKSILFRNALVVIQFTVSIILIVGTVVVFNQLSYIRSKNLGFSKENLLYVPMTGDLWKNYQTLRSELQASSVIKNFSVISDLPTNLTNGTTSVEWEGKQDDEQVIFPNIAVDENFLETFGPTILSGRGFSKEFKADTNNYLVNEKALKVMRMDPATAVGKPLNQWGRKGVIVGIVKDFHFKPIHQSIEPLIIRYNRDGGFIVVRTNPGATEAAIKEMERICRKLNPIYPFEYNFLDQDIANLYQTEQRISALSNAFAVLAILIACLGLFGLAAFTAERRTKEIGIRKVLGASIGGIVTLLSKDFLKLILVALVIATPLAWYVMDQWLDNYSYRISISWWIFALAGAASVLVAFLTISFQSIKAALANPVKSLKAE